MVASDEQLQQALRQYFGLSGFRPMQQEAIESLMAGRDTMVVMPTGGGKSLCYQLPAVLSEGVALIVSPLIALMKDQVDRLTKARIPAVAINSTLSFFQMKQVMERAGKGGIKAIFVSPERLESGRFREALAELPISFMAIDEAHCISEWGHDFRTSYRRLPQLYEIWEQAGGRRPPIIALTATATPEVRADIVQQLALQDPLEIVTGFERSNLQYGVLNGCDKNLRMLDILNSIEGSAIVYASTRKAVESITLTLNNHNIVCQTYHAGLQNELRKRIQERFLKGEIRVIAATSAFGMGIDKSDIRAVIHYDIPASIESYYQEAGRAGRDGKSSVAVLMYNPGDTRTQEYMIRRNSPTEVELRSVYGALHDVIQNTLNGVNEHPFVVEETNILRRIVEPQASLERVIDVLEEEGYVKNLRMQAMHQRSSVQFLANRGRFEEIQFRSNNKGVRTTIDALLRTAGAEAFGSAVELDEDLILENFPLTKTEYRDAIRTLESLGAIRYTVYPKIRPGSKVFLLSLIGERVPANKLPLRLKLFEQRREAALRKLETIVNFATAWQCRSSMILEYFGERGKTCGMCDVCTSGSR